MWPAAPKHVAITAKTGPRTLRAWPSHLKMFKTIGHTIIREMAKFESVVTFGLRGDCVLVTFEN